MSTQTTVVDEVTSTAPAPPVLMADANLIRAAILCVIDSGDPNLLLGTKLWGLWHPLEPVANEARMRFADEVEKRIRELQTDGLGIKLENLCGTHKGMRLPPPTTAWCADCGPEPTRR